MLRCGGRIDAELHRVRRPPAVKPGAEGLVKGLKDPVLRGQLGGMDLGAPDRRVIPLEDDPIGLLVQQLVGQGLREGGRIE